MATNATSQVIQHLRRLLLTDESALTDGQLLGCFIESRDEAAFAALVKRHGALVWNVCRRLLGPQDAEDAFQATFLVLCRKASSIRRREMLASWLYKVAHQTALRAQRAAIRRRVREKQVADMPEPAAVEQDLWNDLLPVLDQELSRLPENHQVVILLCDLEGKSRKEVAQQLGLAEGTVGSRLARARALLAKRLKRHGLLVSGGVLAGLLSQQGLSASVPPAVASSTIRAASLLAAGQTAATGAIAVKVAALTEGVLKAMLFTKLKIASVLLLTLGLIGLASGMLATARTNATGNRGAKAAASPPAPAKAASDERANPLAVTITTGVKEARLNQPFDVALRVVNVSRATKAIQVMSCSWDEQWKSSTDQVAWNGWNCWENALQTLKLEPGQDYKKTLPLFLVRGKPGDKVRFKMGFTSIGSKTTCWSNELTVRIAPAPPEKKAEANGAREQSKTDLDWQKFYDPKAFFLTDPFAVSISKLPAQEKKDAMARLQEALRHREAEIRRRAALTLGSLGDRRGVPTLIADLEKTTGREQDNALVALRIMKDRRAVPGLRKALKSPSAYVRAIAAATLGELKATEAFADLVASRATRGTGT